MVERALEEDPTVDIQTSARCSVESRAVLPRLCPRRMTPPGLVHLVIRRIRRRLRNRGGDAGASEGCSMWQQVVARCSTAAHGATTYGWRSWERSPSWWRRRSAPTPTHPSRRVTRLCGVPCRYRTATGRDRIRSKLDWWPLFADAAVRAVHPATYRGAAVPINASESSDRVALLRKISLTGRAKVRRRSTRRHSTRAPAESLRSARSRST